MLRRMWGWRLPAMVLCSAELLASCAATEPPEAKEVSVATLAACNAPGRCGQSLSCEGSRRSLVGMVDAQNIFDRASHPALPFQKFLVRQQGVAEPVEVWVEGASTDDSAAIFKLVRAAAVSRQSLTIVGRAVGVELPISGQCNRAIKLVVSQKSAVNGSTAPTVRAKDIQGDVSK